MQESLPKKKQLKTNDLCNLIIECIQDKKGEEIVRMDLSHINDAVTDNFVICHASSNTQVKAIGDHIIEKVKDESGEKPWQFEGFNNLEWVLIDYVDVVVHIFQTEKRRFYNLEDLWSDAKFTTYDEN